MTTTPDEELDQAKRDAALILAFMASTGWYTVDTAMRAWEMSKEERDAVFQLCERADLKDACIKSAIRRIIASSPDAKET